MGGGRPGQERHLATLSSASLKILRLHEERKREAQCSEKEDRVGAEELLFLKKLKKITNKSVRPPRPRMVAQVRASLE